MARRRAQIRIPDDTAAAVRRGHPWVFRDRPYAVPAGEVVDVEDDRGKQAGWGLADDGPIAIRVLGRGASPDDVGVALVERIIRADRARVGLMPADTDAYRIVAGEGDGLSGLIVDRYGDLAVLRLYGACWVPWLDVLVRAIAGLPWCKSIYRRLGVGRVDGGDGGQVLHGDDPGEGRVVRECGMRLLVRPKVGQKTGLFLDQREHRALVRRVAAGRKVANLFSYNGGFSVAAALGGATRVISVDIAPEAIADARETFVLNGLNPDDHGFEVADAFEWKPRGTLDLLVVDPPSLAHDRASEGAARKAYARLHARSSPLVAREGLLATSSCTARVDAETWRQIVADGLATTGDWSWLWTSTEPFDHPVALVHKEARYLKFALLRRR